MFRMFLGIDLKLKQITEEAADASIKIRAEKPDKQRTENTLCAEYVDIADLTAYDTLRKILLRKHIYEDDLNIEYSISSGSGTAYYILDEWI